MEERKKLMAIINPFSGNSKKEHVPQLLEDIIDHSKFDLKVELVTRDLRVSDLAAKAVKEGYYGVIAVGGDGTVNGAASALTGSDVALAIIPCGSGNGLARHLEITMWRCATTARSTTRPSCALAAWALTPRLPTAMPSAPSVAL